MTLFSPDQARVYNVRPQTPENLRIPPLAWAPGAPFGPDGKTVIRAGAGIFYDFLVSTYLNPERALLGPPGLGLQNIAGSSIRNPLPNIAGVAVGTPLDFRGSPTLFTGADLMAILSATRASLAQSLAYTGDPSVRAIQITKQAASTPLWPVNVPTQSAQHTSVGVQREIARDFVLNADFVSRHYIHGGLGGPGNGVDLNHFNSVRGPLPTDFTHIVNLAGVTHLPGRFELGLNFTYSSAPPFSPFVGGIDFNGDGTAGDLLPGTAVGAFNRGLGRADLIRLTDQFNQTYAGTTDSHGRAIPRLTLPARYTLDDNSHALDLRLSRSFVFQERWRLSLIGEVFNLYNKANLSGYNGDLTSTAFGQPTSRATQVFGSGGPRAFQLAARVSF